MQAVVDEWASSLFRVCIYPFMHLMDFDVSKYMLSEKEK